MPFPPTVHESVSLPAMGLISPRIPPLPKIAREALITKYCPSLSRLHLASNPTNRDCLARVYLGRSRLTTTPSPNFTLRNFNLHLDQMIELDLSVKTLARAMGEALAVIHWTLCVDAYDIGFVLGSADDAKYTRDFSLTLNLTPEMLDDMLPYTSIESFLRANVQQRTKRLWILDFNLAICGMRMSLWRIQKHSYLILSRHLLRMIFIILFRL